MLLSGAAGGLAAASKQSWSCLCCAVLCCAACAVLQVPEIKRMTDAEVAELRKELDGIKVSGKWKRRKYQTHNLLQWLLCSVPCSCSAYAAYAF